MRIAIGILCGFISIVSSLGMADYAMQAINANQGFLEFGLKGWANSFAERGRIAAEKRRSKQLVTENLGNDLRDLLPAAPAGWTRQSWSITQSKLIKGHYRGAIPSHDELERIAQEELGASNASFSDLMGGYSKATYHRKKAKQTYVYAKGKDRIALSIRQIEAPRKARTIEEAAIRNAAKQTAWSKKEIGFARIRGVVFLEIMDDWEAQTFRTIRADMILPDGSSIRVTALARAKDAEIKRVLNGVDFTRIRKLADPGAHSELMAGVSEAVLARREAAMLKEKRLMQRAAQDRARYRAQLRHHNERYGLSREY
ncbi:hypothetical protein TRP8649_01266 [Pelagimonas phthalicica]|uniref:Uncharacterized protein n=1 Tax=Pelagimonas phthalicica TaxID=1037362 RepID=A0A238JAC9_9RHOB|nr:hypothetical protein [Pelagimonas phthalicica]TDS94309.1 hypothetical protein CLV87_0806 [Pelagimonas phthalicica]SMX27164.1 hypothetical protein TRP8649_01266 [Pelagimonas phthalicica]